MFRFILCVALVLAACGPGRTTFQRYPGAPAAFDRAGSDPKAVEIADQVFTAAGGPTSWDKAKQVRWHQVTTSDGKVAQDGEEGWDRWNARHYGRLHRTDNDIVVGYELYGTKAIAFAEERGKHDVKHNLDEGGRSKAVKLARDVFNVDTTVLLLQFLMMEPGAKLAYVGPAKDDAGSENYDELKVTFADPLRSELEFHPIIDRTTHLIQRIEIIKIGATQKVGYTLKDWTTVGGLKLAQARTNMGYSGETVAITEIVVGNPQDELFIAPITN